MKIGPSFLNMLTHLGSSNGSDQRGLRIEEGKPLLHRSWISRSPVLRGSPKMANMLEDGGKTPILTPLELEDIGYKVVACHLSLMGYPSVQWRDKGLLETKNLRESKGLEERTANKNDKTTRVAYIDLETENRCSSPPSMNISHDDFELTGAETPNYNEH
ncbi:hypothetical protein Tco_1406962 [Tanacetum coccineum]